MNETEKYLSVDEAQALLKSSKRFVYKQVENGSLNLFKVGAKSYLRESEVRGLFQPVAKSKS